MTASPPKAVSAELRTPRAAAIAGVVFAIVMLAALGVIRLAATASQTHTGAWLSENSWRSAVHLALNVIPFGGVAFLWFLGVLRDHLGQREDKFFATVFLGSGLLFVGTLFGATAVLGSIMVVAESDANFPNSDAYQFGVRLSGMLLHIFGIKMASVFMFSTCTIALRTSFLPRWVALTGIGGGLVLLVIITDWPWIELLFPLWVLSVSIRILVADILGKKLLRPIA